ncbi:hypothetical protein MASR2M8_16740 [Opitutaceae bacterium]
MTRSDELPHTPAVSAAPVTSFPGFLGWISAHAGFPRHRLPGNAERLLLLAVAASLDEAEDTQRQRFLIKSKDPASVSALKAHAMRRSQVHFKCDNSAKV